MKKIVSLIALTILLTVSCEKPESASEPGVVTLDITDLSATTATFNGKLILPDENLTGFEFGFELSESPSFAEMSTTRYKAENYDDGVKTFRYNARNVLKASRVRSSCR